MRQTITVHSVPLWPLVKNVFIISLIVLTLSMMIMGLFWMGMFREFAAQFAGTQAGAGFEMFRNLGGAMVVIFSIVNGILSSFFLTIFTGFAGLIYNWMNSRHGGFEFEISVPEQLFLHTEQESPESPDTPETGFSTSERES